MISATALGSVSAWSAEARAMCCRPARCESLAIFARRGLEYANKSSSHLFFTTVPAIVGNRFDAIVRFFEAPPGCIQADRLHRLGRRATALFCIDPSEVSRTHTRPFGQRLDAQVRGQVFCDPTLQLGELVGFRISLARKQRTVLR